jgi:hypothetical protein
MISTRKLANMNQGVKASSSIQFWGNFGARLSTSMVQACCRWMNPMNTQNPTHYACTQTEHHIAIVLTSSLHRIDVELFLKKGEYLEACFASHNITLNERTYAKTYL